MNFIICRDEVKRVSCPAKCIAAHLKDQSFQAITPLAAVLITLLFIINHCNKNE